LPRIDLSDVPRELLRMCWEDLPPRERAKVLADSPQTVWWFGAGASHHYDANLRGVNMPLANGFFEAFHLLPTSAGLHAHVGPLISFLEHYRGVPPQEVAGWMENIEDFMTSVEREITELKTVRRKRKLQGEEIAKAFSLSGVFGNMTFIMSSVVNEAQNGPSESAYRYLLNFCGPDDVFISFNWDTLLDRALADSGGWTPNTGYGLRFASALDSTWKPSVEGLPEFETNWKLLKVHGSTNWLVPYTYVDLQTLEQLSLVPKSDSIFLYWQSTLPYATHRSRWRGGYVPTTYCYYPPNIPTAFFRKKDLAPPGGKTIVRAGLKRIFSPSDEPQSEGVPASPLLITPVRQKKYDMYESTIQSLWKQSAESFKTAQKVVIIGYSFPPTDTRALELLRDGLDARRRQIDVEVVSPDAQDICKRISKRLNSAKSLKAYNLKFEDYLNVLVEQTPGRILEVAEKSEDIRKWIEGIYAMTRFADQKYRAARKAGTRP
jgi:hypothetical protein